MKWIGKKRWLWGWIGLILMASCSPKIIPSTDEDFSVYRTRYKYKKETYDSSQPGQVVEIPLEFDSTAQRYDITLALNKLLDYRPPEYIPATALRKMEGWRIQVYRGRSREAASKARQRCYDLFSNRVTPYLYYSTPTYRVKVGDFLEPYEYEAVYKILKKEFPSALPVPDIVNIIVQNRSKGDGVEAPTPNPNPDRIDNK